MTCKADERFEAWVSSRFEAGLTPITDLELTVWRAAWISRGVADVEAVEAVGKTPTRNATVNSDWLAGIKAGIKHSCAAITTKIRALDEGGGDAS
jgi:hypothetical protein